MSLGATRSPFFSIVLLSFVALGIYGFLGPFWALPSDFLTGFSAASGIALVTSIANLGGFSGSYAVGLISGRTGSLHGGMALAGASYFLSATLVLLLPKGTRSYYIWLTLGRQTPARRVFSGFLSPCKSSFVLILNAYMWQSGFYRSRDPVILDEWSANLPLPRLWKGCP
jgi:hypothetical protein